MQLYQGHPGEALMAMLALGFVLKRSELNVQSDVF